MTRLLCFVLLCTAPCWCAAQLQRFQAEQPKMGSPFRIVFYAPDTDTAATLITQAFALVDSLNHIFSDYEATSELNYVNSTAGSDSFIAVSAPLYAIVTQSIKAAQKSRGAFDITIGPLSRLWRESRRQARFPEDADIQRAKRKTGFRKIIVDTTTHKIKLFQKAMQLDLGGIAKGYAAQAVVDFLRHNGVTSALADAGGDIACSDAPPQKKGWTVGINAPEHADNLVNKNLVLQNAAVATSGDVYQFIAHDGKKFSHILNPKTGYGVTFQRNVTVIAPDGATADWLATACSILAIHKAKKLARKNGAALFIGVLKKDRLRFYKTGNCRRYLRAVGS